MANLEKRNDRYRIVFRLNGEKFSKTLCTTDQNEAEMWLAKANHRINQIKLGNLELPQDGDLVDFVLDSPAPITKQIKKVKKAKNKAKKRKSVTIAIAWKEFNKAIPEESLEESTLKGMKTHIEHLARLIGRKVKLKDIDKPKRSKEKWNNRLISPQTIKKELTTLRLIWNWCKDRGLVTGRTPTRGVVLPKTPEKPRFMTIDEINRTIARGGVSDDEQRLLWESLFLQQQEVTELLQYVKKNAKFRFVYPMFVFIAHTGVRRSEMVRSRIDDLNFENGVVLVREKKKSRVRSVTFRHVEMSPLFEAVMKEWLSDHPGGQHTICFTEEIQGRRGEQLTNDASNHHFGQALKGSKWNVVKGFHKTIVSTGWHHSLIPDDYLVTEFFQVEADEIESLEAKISEAESEKSEAVELAQEVISFEPEKDDKGNEKKVTASAIKKAIKVLVDDLRESDNKSAAKEIAKFLKQDKGVKSSESKLKKLKTKHKDNKEDLYLKLQLKRLVAKDHRLKIHRVFYVQKLRFSFLIPSPAR